MNHLTNHHYKFMQLRKQWQELELLSIADGDAIVQIFETGIRYLEDFKKHLEDEVKLLNERHQMNLYFTTVATDGPVQLHFLKDQFVFLKDWFVDFEKVVFPFADRCQLNLSVREVLYLIRLLRDAGLLEKEELKYTYRFLGNNFRTAQQKLLSVESLRKKYSQLDKRVMHNTTALLARLAELNKAYLLAAKAGTV
ncbi:hypothetical protein [Sphingobacterium yanglingense]|uniref:Uncharacterized protein n=1 Tax=Sphingobacterium yanglingense TaxID=1437280 RepID=A0A4R6WMC4_9SPHI|nr:hypothetical protein [Sphingobacterium yanglingense]TDQ79241.1 hypothetical protein CLV99_0674 [Sphingobacterium yanglingense]